MPDRSFALEVPRSSYFTDEVVEGTLVFSTSGESNVRGLTLTIQGRERVTISHGAGKSRHTHRASRDVVAWQIPFLGPGPVAAGAYRFPFQFRIPKDALPSHRGTSATIQYTLKARLDVPLAFDLVQDWELFVFYDRASVRGFARPIRFQSPGNRAAVYVELDGDRFFARELIGCRITLLRTGKRRIRRVYVRLVGVEDARAGHAHTRIPATYAETSVPFEMIRRGTPFTFEMPIPATVPSAYQGVHSRLDYELQVGLDLAWARDIVAAMPIVVVQ